MKSIFKKYLDTGLLLGIDLVFYFVGDAVGAPLFHVWSQQLSVEGRCTISFVFLFDATFFCGVDR